MSIKNSNDIIRNRTSDLPICSASPSPLCYRGPLKINVSVGTYTGFAKFYRQCLLENMPLAATASFMLDWVPTHILVDLCAMYSVFT